MENLFRDEEKINIYAKIHKCINSLQPDSDEEAIDSIFEIIPSEFLNQKNELIMICQFFGFLARYGQHFGHLVIKLFERIMNFLKIYLQNESSIVWNFFGGHFCFKLWMYEEGLIDIDTIVLSAQKDETSKTARFFLPEIIEHYPEIFHKEIKHSFEDEFSDEKKYSKEYLEEFKALRKKFFLWLKESGDYKDQIYSEIETDPVRLAIKRDDVSSFQILLSQKNLSIDSLIEESLLENFLRLNCELHLIEYSLNYHAFNIFKFLFINGANLSLSVIDYAIHSNNYDIIHMIEPKLSKEFDKYSLLYAIVSGNQEIAEYIMENYNYDFLRSHEDESSEEDENDKDKIKEDENDNDKVVDIENSEDDLNKNENEEEEEKTNENEEEEEEKEKTTNENIVFDKETEGIILNIIENTFFSFNFQFFKSTLLPFFLNNQSFVNDHFHDILVDTKYDHSCFFASELLKYPDIDVNYSKDENDPTFLESAIYFNNTSVVELILNHPTVDINLQSTSNPLFCACVTQANLKIVKMICSKPGVDVNFTDPDSHFCVVEACLFVGNVFAMKYLIENFKELKKSDFLDAFSCINDKHYLTMKIFIEWYIDEMGQKSFDEMINNVHDELKSENNFDEKSWDVLNMLIDEIKSK